MLPQEFALLQSKHDVAVSAANRGKSQWLVSANLTSGQAGDIFKYLRGQMHVSMSM